MLNTISFGCKPVLNSDKPSRGTGILFYVVMATLDH